MTRVEHGHFETRSVLCFGTRRSDLALWQTRFVAARLKSLFPDLSIREQEVQTQGDIELEKPLPEFGGKGLFTQELDSLLLAGEIDAAVHSLKDLPTQLSDGLVFGAILNREDPRDVWICPAGYSVQDVPAGSRVGTCSLRRQAQILALRPDLQVVPIRGNVPTRIEKVMRGDFDAIVIAAAGVKRLGMDSVITEFLSLDEVLPAPGQGALAVTCRQADRFVRGLLSAIHEPKVEQCTSAERNVLTALGGGCTAPIAACTMPCEVAATGENHFRLIARVLSPDGTSVVTVSEEGRDAAELADRVANLLMRQGASQILENWHSKWQRSSGSSGINAKPQGRLSGRKIAVTRSTADAEAFAALLRAEGAEPILLPVIECVPLPCPELESQLRQLRANDWLVLSSAVGLRFLHQAIPNLAQTIEHLRLACVGSATAAAARNMGLTVSFVPEKFTGQDLANTLPLSHQPETILWIRPQEADERMAEILRRRGAKVRQLHLYATVPRSLNQEQRESLRSDVDMLTFTSSSAVNHFFDQLDAEELELLSRVKVACIGTVTDETLATRFRRADVVPDEHTIAGMIEAIAEFF